MAVYRDQPRAKDSNGKLLPGAKLYFSAPGSADPVDVFADGDLRTPLPNPLTFDAAARCPPFWLDPDQFYRLRLFDAAGNQIFDVDPYSGTFPGSTPFAPLSDAGVALPNARLTLMVSGTTQIEAQYTANAAGVFASVTLDDDTLYRAQLHTADGLLVYDVDPVQIYQSGDPYFDNVAFLAHFDQANTFKDFSNNNLSSNTTGITPHTLNTSEFKFGNASVNQVALGTGEGSQMGRAYAHHDSLNLQGNFTIEAWVRFSGHQSPVTSVLRKGDASGPVTYFLRLRQSGGAMRANFLMNRDAGFSNDVGLDDPAAFPINAWTHFAVTRSGQTFRMFVNGALVASLTTGESGWRPAPHTEPLFIGNFSNVFADGVVGQVDDIRITNGVARYTANFTPPDAAFPNF